MMKPKHKELLLRLLDYAGIRSEAEKYAEKLIARSMTFPDILRSSAEDLEQVGLPESAAVFLSMLLPTVRCCKERTLLKRKPVCNSAELLGGICTDLLRHYKTEHSCALLLDEGMNLINILHLSEGSIASTVIPVAELARAALKNDAYYIVLAHNHPDGTPEPSDMDSFTTEELKHSLGGMGITLLEHFVVSDDDYYPILLHTCRGKLCPEKIISSDFYSVAMRKSAGIKVEE